jgi:hypothetical protein
MIVMHSLVSADVSHSFTHSLFGVRRCVLCLVMVLIQDRLRCEPPKPLTLTMVEEVAADDEEKERETPPRPVETLLALVQGAGGLEALLPQSWQVRALMMMMMVMMIMMMIKMMILASLGPTTTSITSTSVIILITTTTPSSSSSSSSSRATPPPVWQEVTRLLIAEGERLPVPAYLDSLSECLKLLEELMMTKAALPFNVPVNPVRNGMKDYLKVIQQPMDLGTIVK